MNTNVVVSRPYQGVDIKRYWRVEPASVIDSKNMAHASTVPSQLPNLLLEWVNRGVGTVQESCLKQVSKAVSSVVYKHKGELASVCAPLHLCG